MTLRTGALLSALTLLACDPPRRAWPDSGVGVQPVEAPAEAHNESVWGQDGGTPQGKLYPARRCGECHGRQREEWRKSAHALASGDLFNATLAKVDAPSQPGCLGCHRPLEAAGPRVAPDGVACDACHTATAPGEGQGVTLSPELATRFGPFKDSKDHHFHRVGYSAFVTGDELCLACHQDRSSGGLSIYTTGAEWKASGEKKRCSECHMPGFTAIAAKGEKVRPVSHHDFGAVAGKAQSLSIALQLKVEREKGALLVSLLNQGAAHALPTGRPERRLRLEVHFRAADDQPLGSLERVYGRRLVDAGGKLAPSFKAVKEESDGRLFEGKARQERFAVPKSAVSAQLQLYYEPFDPELASWFGAAERVLVWERREALNK